LRIAIAAFIAGGSLLLFLPSLPENWLLISTSFVLLGLIGIYAKPTFSLVRSASIIALFFALGFGWNANYAEQRLSNILSSSLEDVELLIEGRVSALPQSGPTGAKFTFDLISMSSRGKVISNFPKRIYLNWQNAWRNPQETPKIIPGQRWKLKVKLKRPYGSLNPYTFDFERWAFQQNFGANGSVKSGELLASGDIALTNFSMAMEYWRWKLRNKIERLLPSDARYAGVIIALVMGDQNAIDQDDWRIFNATGVGHLISISGLHVTMLAGLGAGLAALLWGHYSLPLRMPIAKVAAFSGFITAFIYAWLAGFQIPAQRTLYMVGIVSFALWSGRNPRSFDIWWWALAFVLLVDPMAPYTPGFWLSFGAVAAILYAMRDSVALLGIPTGRELGLSWHFRVIEALREACRVQAVVTIALLPFTLYWFYQASIVSPLANAFAVPLISYIVTPFAMLGAFLPEWMGKAFLLWSHSLIEAIAFALNYLADLKWAIVRSKQPEMWLLIPSLLGIVIAIRPGRILTRWRSRVFGLALSLIIFVEPFDSSLHEGEFRVTVLDIGQGTAVLIETVSKKLLYDTGPTLGVKDDAGMRTILPYLRGRGIHHIDRMVISHGDSDHVGGGISLLKEVRFDSMMGSLPSENALLKKIQAKNIPNTPCQFGQTWIWDEVEFYIWHPSKDVLTENQQHGKPNEMSCVLEVRNKETSFWLTGDIERDAEGEIIERLNTDQLADLKDKELIWMAPHHGSKTSSSLNLLIKINPDQAFAQNGYRNRYGHPHPVVTARYKNLDVPFHQTSLTGAQIWTFQTGARSSTLFWRRENARLWHRPLER